ncbi:MAG TPA: GntR family transcriptional regulator [Acidimicrobiales bacterium]|nr:GntR family transcriptional regulator [Acidimicrobiales bacterium]
MQPVDRDSPVPLWAQVYDDLRRRLAAGEFAGEFPGEMALVEQYGISRNTVREAMRRLRADGSVVAGRGRKPRLAGDTRIEQPLGALYSLFASVESSGLEQRSVVRALDVRTDPDAAERLSLPADAALFHLERLRMADGEPLAVDRVWMPADLGAPLLDVDFRSTGFYQELLARAGVAPTGGRERIRAVVPAPGDRRLLRLGRDVAALWIDRVSYAGDRAVEWRSTLVRGDRFSLVAEFSAKDGYQLGVPV